MLVTSFTGHRKHRYLLRSFGLRRAAGVLCSGARSRSYRDARAWPPAEVAPKPCLCPPFRTVYLFACTPYRVPIIALSLFRPCIDRFRRLPRIAARSLEFDEWRVRAGRARVAHRMTSVKLLVPRPLETIRHTRSVQTAWPSRAHEDLDGGQTLCDLRGPGEAQSLQQAAPGGDGAGAYEDMCTVSRYPRRCGAGPHPRLGPRVPSPRCETTKVNSQHQTEPPTRRQPKSFNNRASPIQLYSQKHLVLVSVTCAICSINFAIATY